jgi:hypothetical protein
MTRRLHIGSREIGAGRPLYVIALAGSGHGSDVQLGYKVIETTGAAGADAVVIDAPGRLSARDFKSLLGQAQHVRMTALPMPTDGAGVDLMATLDVPGVVVRDGDDELLRRAASIGRPIVVWSRGPRAACARALQICTQAGNHDAALLYDGGDAETIRALHEGPIGVVARDEGERALADSLGASIVARAYALSDFIQMKAWVRQLRNAEAAAAGVQQGRP